MNNIQLKKHPSPEDMVSKDVSRAAAVLRRGGLAAFPTETVYGLGADALNATAVARIFAVKGRPASHPLIVHIPRAADIEFWAADIGPEARLLAERFWPGPLTLVLRAQPLVPRVVTGGLDTVGLRVPDHPMALALLETFGGGVAAPSANRFGKISPTEAAHVFADLGSDVDFILDGGKCGIGIESTIVDVSGGSPVILRPGGVTREALEDALKTAVPAAPDDSMVRAPGRHPSHYAPRARVLLARQEEISAAVARLTAAGQRVAVMAPDLNLSLPPQTVRIPLPASLQEMARQLYSSLRASDALGVDVIVAATPQDAGLGLAIADRLRRAAGPRHEGNA